MRNLENVLFSKQLSEFPRNWAALSQQELLLKNDLQTSLILFLFPKINEKGSLEKAES